VITQTFRPAEIEMIEFKTRMLRGLRSFHSSFHAWTIRNETKRRPLSGGAPKLLVRLSLDMWESRPHSTFRW